ncbi:Transducin/WD40 repeat-like superfamily protein isoform 2 [Hibiscus syriacus]|uniref:Transducin/WD40 repeat-like superfamily protein isoform 2 n=1 Tax=Hibiscus syriacus TaxID=106335 RepID=A0A6A3AHJ4_HIBSY|nr:DDB1- and CUL4-associated factor 8-like [Hibiscus syriacus]KAE8702242.1 Transducin/WD40 repeat-like superfamily protein isoform 2 [Hibiscus syriacus]
MMKNKRARTSVDKAVVDVWQREVGALSTRNFAHRLAASEDLVLRLEIYKKLEKHRGCVNTVSFNADGNILVTGSDDRRVILWDWERGHAKLTFQSGHVNNVFQAKIMPYSDDRTLVTCAADGQVRQAQILERGVETKLLAKHQGRAHKLAIEPGSPHIFYTCGEDGLVQHIDLRTAASTELFTCRPIDDSRASMAFIHLNAIAIDPRNPNLFAVAGSDEYTRLYDIRKYKWDGSTDFGQPADYFCPPHLIGDDQVGITGLAFSDQSELLVSYNDEFIYLFTWDMGLGPNPVPSSPLSAINEASELGFDHSAMDSNDKVVPQVYKGHRNCDTVKGVSFFGPKSDYVVSGSDCGRIFIWKKKVGELIRVMEADKDVVNCIESHPHTTVLASSGIESDIKIWTPKGIDKPTLPINVEQFKPKPRAWMHRFASPQDLMLHLFSMRRWDSSPERNGENSSSAASQELLQLIWTFNANSDASDDGGNASGPEDLFC